jgi:hypothetical protein
MLLPICFSRPIPREQQQSLVTMEKNLNSSHVERRDNPTIVHSGEVYTDEVLSKAGVEELREDTVANVHLVSSAPALDIREVHL